MSVLAESKASTTTSAPKPTLPNPSLRRFSSSKSPSIARALSSQASCCSTEQNLDTDSGKNACSPDYSFDSGIGASSEVDLRKLIRLVSKTVRKEVKSSGSDTAGTAALFSGNSFEAVGIGTGISCNAEEQMRQKLRYERLQQWRLILYSLDRQKHPYRLLRERLSKICEGRVSKKESSNEDICNVCSCQIDLNESKNFVTCYICNKRVCRAAKCSNWLPRSDRWECQLCKISKDTLTHTQSWIAEQMSFNRQIFRNTNPMRARSEIFIPIGDYNESSMQFESVSQVGLSSAAITSEQKLKIREYVEEVVEKLLGGSLDQIRVGQLSKSENYLPGIINSHAGAPQTLAGQNSNQSNENVSPEVPEISQTRLRQMIELIIAETLRSPEIALNTHASNNELAQTVSKSSRNGDVRQSGTTERYFEPRIYQELLATAVLNRIADKEGNFRQFSESTPDLSLSNINGNIDVQDRSISSTSSAEPRSDFSYTDTEQSPKISKVSGRESILNEYIASHTVPLPDFSTAVTESEEDDHDSISSSVMADGNWEDNWLFKKKSSSLTTSMTGSVGMLVPAPKDDVRAQIGDKTADEISDLSEMGSDTDDSSAKPDEDLNPLNDRILNKHLIGGQNTGVILDELMETASLISTTSHSQDEPKFTEATNERIINIALKYESVDTKADAKYNDPKPEPVCDSLSGSIAEREHKKWNNAVEMPNNPYTTEALQRRISGSQERIIDLPNISGSTERNPISIATKEPEAVTGNEIRTDIDYKRYSRDYYINDDNVAKTSPKHQIATGDEGITDKLATVDIMNEVNYNGKNKNKGIPFSDHNDCHWILSTPVRRSSSLKIINRRSPPKSYSNFRANATPTSPKYYQKHYLPQRSYSSMSHYDNLDRIHLQDNQRNAIARHSNCYHGNIKCGACEDGLIVNIDGNTGNVDLDIYNDLNDYSDHRHSERAWRSASANSYYPTTLPARHTPSSLSFNSSASGTSVRSSKSKHSSSHNINILSQFEKQLLHKDLKRNSFRAISATSKEFVMNPLYELENINGTSDGSENTNSQGKTKRTNKHSRDEQIDSGVDSFLNGFNEIEVKVNDTTTNLPI